MKMENTPKLKTERLVLRKFTMEDLEALYEILSDEEVNRFLPWFPMTSLTEAGKVLIERVKEDGIPYVTATHDAKNASSGAVMKKLGMHYQYSYEELWQPKNIPVLFRMYQLNLDGQQERVYRKYWEQSEVHFVEKLQR